MKTLPPGNRYTADGLWRVRLNSKVFPSVHACLGRKYGRQPHRRQFTGHEFNSTTEDKPQGVAGQRLDVMDDPISGDMTDPLCEKPVVHFEYSARSSTAICIIEPRPADRLSFLGQARGS